MNETRPSMTGNILFLFFFLFFFFFFFESLKNWTFVNIICQSFDYVGGLQLFLLF
jgi:hypothetical protein